MLLKNMKKADFYYSDKMKFRISNFQFQIYTLTFLAAVFLWASCETQQDLPKKPGKLFTLLENDDIGIDFINQLTYDSKFNIYTYRNFYNGGGVGFGDINNDGLIDIYFTSNMDKNKLYLNRGDFSFEDITEKAMVGGERSWSTGVSFADVNGDGLLDIYVCNSGDLRGDNKQNEFFLNNGDLTFTERAEEFGIADRGLSTHAAFFDYDRDGDLDLYLLNNSYRAIGSFNLQENERYERDTIGGDKLFRNDENYFVDVSEEAGIYGSIIGFGLGVTVGDVNKDGWPDIYVSNDFFERDYLYINNQDGTFSEQLEQQMRSISVASMGADMADINNDAYPEIFVTEMLPEKDARRKTVTTFENWDKYQLNLKYDYYHQFTRNMLHLNNTDNTFSEIGRLAGVEATDWSWAALITDYDMDGLKDLFIANGIYQDLTNQDYLNYMFNENVVKRILSEEKVDFKEFIDAMPSNRIPNYAYKNAGNYRFENKTEAWGLDSASHSNGSAYGDLDNDGDLDLVVNNVNMPPFIYRNEGRQLFPNRNYLQFELHGADNNTAAIGAQITAVHQERKFYVEQIPTRGFQSSIDPRPYIGLGGVDLVDSVIINWPNGNFTILTDISANQTLELKEAEAIPLEIRDEDKSEKIFTEEKNLIDYTHVENHFVDFDRDRLIYHMLSTEGPNICTGDVNGDGLEDFYVGGAKDSPGALFVQNKNGGFISTNETLWEKDKISEDIDCLFFDADNDNDHDLYVTSGGNEFSSSSSALIDRLYINDGKGNYTRSKQSLPTFQFESTSTVAASDIDNDGDQDLFVGVRLKPHLYGVPMNGYLLLNDGHGNFENVTDQIAPELLKSGMFTDAVWSDVDQDGDEDLITVGEWMPVRIFLNEEGIFKEATEQMGLGKSNGWWNAIAAEDLDNDGDIDFVVGNHGLNSRFETSIEKPATLYINDFDRNGTAEQILSLYEGDISYPLVLKHDLVMQMPSLKKKYLKYESYKEQTVNDLFTPAQLENAIVLKAFTFESSVLLNNGKGKFKVVALPSEAQFSPVYGISIADFNGDKNKDILLGGNFYNAKPEVGRYDADFGLLLKGRGDGSYKVVKSKDSGFNNRGQIRDLKLLEYTGGDLVLAAKNDGKLQVFKF